jgi:hypothetical protein
VAARRLAIKCRVAVELTLRHGETRYRPWDREERCYRQHVPNEIGKKRPIISDYELR